jgi:hypothetical protein
MNRSAQMPRAASVDNPRYQGGNGPGSPRPRRVTATRSRLDDHRVIVHYQPVIDLSTGNVAGFEALARIVAHDGSMAAAPTTVD